jgi:hypothetical protein
MSLFHASQQWSTMLSWDVNTRFLTLIVARHGKMITTRTHVPGEVGNVFRAAGIALPANIAEQPAS